MNRLLIVWAAAFLLAAGGCWWLAATYAPGLTAGAIFVNADILVKLIIMLITPLGLATIVGGLVRNRPLVLAAGGACAVLGLLAMAWGEMNIQTAMRAVGAVSLAVRAPGHAENLFALAWGLAPGVLGLLALRLRGPAPSRPSND